MMLRTELSAHERLVLLALPASSFSASVVDSSSMRLALGAATFLASRSAVRVDPRRAIFMVAERTNVDDIALLMRRAGFLDITMDVNFMLRAKPSYRPERAARSGLIEEVHAAPGERAPEPAVATSVLLLHGTQQSFQLQRSQEAIHATIERWRTNDATLASAFDAYDALRTLH